MQRPRKTILFTLSVLLICCVIQIPLLQPSIESGKEELYWITEARYKPDITHQIQYPDEYWNDRINFLINRTNKQVLLQNLFWTSGLLGILLFLFWFNQNASNKKNGCATHPALYIMLSTICMLFSFVSWFFLLNALDLNNKFDEWHEIYFKLTWFSTPIGMTAALLLSNNQSKSCHIITPRQKRIIGIVWACSMVLFILSLFLYSYASVLDGYDLH